MPATNLITSKLVFRRAQSHSLSECRRSPSARFEARDAGYDSSCAPSLTMGQTQRDETVFRTTGSGQEIALWASIASILAAAIGFSWNANPLAQAFAAIFIACALIRRSCLWSAPSLNPVCIVQLDCAHDGKPWHRYGLSLRQLSFRAGRGFPPYRPRSTHHRTVLVRAGYFSWTVTPILLDGADRQLDRPFN
ncbi:hypothetical protein ABIF38_008923 [Bradyrhizobium japonicum]|uniref:Uncharacterized protein n=1 Tax=Bradyrhizobium elkanii TaxID=29448 RepID=A0ABV4ETW7_BRAEL|nr:hypothetical protein [Bradyrhizobium elkanii]